VLRNIADLELQLDQERNRREKLEMKLDQYKLDIAYLTSQLDQLSTVSDPLTDVIAFAMCLYCWWNSCIVLVFMNFFVLSFKRRFVSEPPSLI
jgi:hypothetical protein